MSDLRDLYQEVILDHGRRPRNFRKIEDASLTAVGHNPLCGDKLAVYVNVVDGVVKDVSFQGAGCAISTASASMMTEAILGKSVDEAHKLYHEFHHMLTESDDAENEDLEKLQVFSGVREYPARVKCATLAWHTIESALNGEPDATTE